MISVELRNGIIMHKMHYIEYILSRYIRGPNKDKLHNAVLYIARRIDSYNSTKGCLNTWLWSQVRGSLSLRNRLNHEYATDNCEALACNRRTPRSVLMHKEYNIIRHTAIQKALSNISLRDRWIIKEHFFNKRSMTSIAEDEGVTQQAISQIIQKALKRMRRDIEHYAVDLGRA